ncbi:MAG TPA: hypothetical protein VI636_23345 [Candidatus Angelobacter sp.]
MLSILKSTNNLWKTLDQQHRTTDQMGDVPNSPVWIINITLPAV